MKEDQGGAAWKSTEVSLLFILFLVFFSLALERTSVFFLVRGEPLLVLKGSSLRGIFLLSTAPLVSGEVLIGACAKRGLI